MKSSRDPGPADPAAELAPLRGQRELALACVWLSFVISAAVLLGNFGREPESIPSARALVETHRKLLAGEQANLRVNEAVLRQNQEALANIRKAVNTAKP